MTWKVTRSNLWKDIANLQIKRLNNHTKSQHHAWMTINYKKKKKMSQEENCLQFSVFGSYWETWYFLVRKQICSWSHWMDQSLWQTLGAFDLLHSSYKWIAARLLCAKHNTTMQTWFVSRLWFWRRLWRFKINFSRGLMYFRKQNICSCKLDVQDTYLSLTQFHRIWDYFSGCRFTHGWDPPMREPRGKPSAVVKPNMHNSIPIKHTNVIPTNIDHIPPNTTHSHPSAMLYVFEDNEAVIKNDYHRSKFHNEACFTDPQSCSGLVVWQD